MIRNHILFAIRLFFKDRAYSILNILGLTLGISVALILILYLQYDLSYDKHHKNHKQIFRLTNHLMAQGADFYTARTARELAPIMKDDLPEIIDYVRFITWEDVSVTTVGNDEPISFIEDDIVVTDSNVFKYFTHPFVEGNPEGSLTGPNKVVISKSIARKFFGDKPALGEQLFIDEKTWMVTGVMEDMPRNSHLYYSIMLSDLRERRWIAGAKEEGLTERISEGFWNPSSYTYLIMSEDYDITKMDQRFQDVLFEKTFGQFAKRIEGSVKMDLQPLASVHFGSDMTYDEPQGDEVYLLAFTIIGVVIILLAAINYMNLATARSVVRTTEIAVRKVMGNSKRSLFLAVVLESIVLSFFAMILAVGLVLFILHFTTFESLIDKDISQGLQHPLFYIGTPVIAVFIGVVSGIYPAIYLPSMPIVSALKGKGQSLTSSTWIRKSMIVFQFVISLFVIISTYLMDKQIEFMRQTELGFSKDNIVTIGIPNDKVQERIPAMKAALNEHSGVTIVSTSYGVPGVNVGGQVFMVERDGELKQQDMSAVWVGDDFLETMDIELIAGRTWFEDSENDRLSVIVNETAVREFGWDDDPLSKRVRYFHGEEDGNVIGVVKDFNYRSLHNEIEPLFIVKANNPGGSFLIRIAGNNISGTLEHIESTWREFNPNEPYEYHFLDQEFDKQYRQDEIQKSLISVLSYISIFISLLGLIGLSAFTAGQKVKEIGVRKTLGASVGDIVVLFSKDYLKLIVIALIIAIPVANYVVTEWLDGFAYQLPILWWHYIIPGSLVLLLGLMSVSWQSFRAAKMDPVRALRTE